MTFTEPTKWCPKCEQDKPESLFARDKKKIDGLFQMCKLCFRKTRLKAGDVKSIHNNR